MFTYQPTRIIDNNIVIGFESLHSNTEGSNNIVIGNSINFGDGSGEESNKLYIGSYKDSTDTACGFIFGDMTKTSNSSPNTPSITLKAKKITIGNGVAPDAGIADDTGAELTVNTVVNTIGNGDDDSLLTVNTVKTTIGKDGNAQTFINGSAYIGTEVAANNANKIVIYTLYS